MSEEGNAFGGANRNGLYVPMSETEREFIQRLIDAGDLKVTVHGWGYFPAPRVTLGEYQVIVELNMVFDAPATPMAVSYFDLELGTHGGVTLFRERQSIEYGGAPMYIQAGTELTFAWHIGVKCIDPALIKMLMPGARGLTSRRIDRDTGAVTAFGNMALDAEQKRLMGLLLRGEGAVREANREAVRKALKAKP